MCSDISAGPVDFICSSEVRQIEEVACYMQNVRGLVHDEHENYAVIFGVAGSSETLVTKWRCYTVS